jgi:predicted ribosome quality control (RQC) complex YloA/Tae2 family protein
MAFDALMLAAVRDELRSTVLGGLVQRVVQSGPLELGLEVYRQRQRFFLLCSADPERARVCLSGTRPTRESDTPSPMLLLLRKYVRDGRICQIDQPPFERVLSARISKRREDGQSDEVELIIETMGRRSNALLLRSDRTILAALKTVGPARNPRRPVLPGRPYAPPPAQDQRLDPTDPASYDRLAERAESQPDRPLEDLLRAELAGCSPLLARELAFRAAGRVDARLSEVDWPALAPSALELYAPLATGAWSPSVAVDADQPIAFAPYRLTHLPDAEVRELSSPSAAVELGLSGSGGRPAALSPARRALVGEVDRLEGQVLRRVESLRAQLQAAEQAESLRLAAEALLANLATIQPGQRRLSFADLELELDPDLSPLEQSQRLFARYRKARDAGRNLPAMIASAELQRRHLAELRALAESAESPASQRSLREELDALAGRLPPSRKAGRAGPSSAEAAVLRARSPDGLDVLVGTSARANDLVTFRLAGPEDLWLHARGAPGAHVVVKTAGREPSAEGLRFAARLAARHSQLRRSGRVEVDYTPRKFVRRVPNSPPGLVTYREERTISVEPS